MGALVNKISVKKVCGVVEVPTGKTQLMEVHGIAVSFKTGESHLGPWTALEGRFRATRLSDGEVFDSGTCHLPRMALELILPILKSAEAGSLEFAFIVGVVPATNAYGYEYYVESMLEAKESDPLELLTKRVAQASASKSSLPSPKPALVEKSKAK